ncbi:MAG: hypothetical protein KA712_07860 [Myxococcales bacterium]|nr:hypothetical protein [Myxococcales bacterium]
MSPASAEARTPCADGFKDFERRELERQRVHLHRPAQHALLLLPQAVQQGKPSRQHVLAAVGESIADGMYWVIDADIERYFDSTPHDRLMKVVARRVVDSSILALIRMFLAAPVIDERNGVGPRRPLAGVPQGGVVSPLLANLYLHLMDRNFRRRVEHGELSGRLVRYCDDFVLVTRLHPASAAWRRG